MAITTKKKELKISFPKPNNKSRLYMSYDDAVDDNKKIAEARDKMNNIHKNLVEPKDDKPNSPIPRKKRVSQTETIDENTTNKE